MPAPYFCQLFFEIRATKLDFCKLFAEIEQLFYKKLADFKRIFSKTKKLKNFDFWETV